MASLEQQNEVVEELQIELCLHWRDQAQELDNLIQEPQSKQQLVQIPFELELQKAVLLSVLL